MKLTEDLKKTGEKAETKNEDNDVMKKAGIFLDDEELENVSGGNIWEINQLRQELGGLSSSGKFLTTEQDIASELRKYDIESILDSSNKGILNNKNSYKDMNTNEPLKHEEVIARIRNKKNLQ